MGAWLCREPLNTLPTPEDRYAMLASSGQIATTAWSMALSSDHLDYVAVRNSPMALWDFLGLCVPLPDSGPGAFKNNAVPHRLFGAPASSLTFTVCCPALFPHLSTWGVMSPRPAPPTTADGNNFPWSAAVGGSPAGRGPCYTIILNVTTTASINDFFGDLFVGSVRIVGSCCCTRSKIQKLDPPVTPPPPPVPAPRPIPSGY